MKQLYQLTTRNIDRVILFIILFFYFFSSFFQLCRIYRNNDFDSQTLLAWDYSASIGMMPFNDIFYPYGLLSFYKNHFFWANMLYLVIGPILFTAMYILFNKLYNNKIVSFFIVAYLFLFVQKYISWETFNRYGVFTFMSLFFSYYFYTNKISRKFLITIGIIIGLIFSLITDQGVYILLTFFLLFLFFEKTTYQSSLTEIFQRKIMGFVVFLLGFFLGLMPFFIYLVFTNSFAFFFAELFRTGQIAQYAKIPFLPGLKSPENIFVLSLLFFSIFYTGFIHLFSKKKYSLSTAYIMTLIVVLIILEQKNIIRSIDRSLTFVGILMLFVFISEKKKFWFLWIFVLLFIYYVAGFSQYIRPYDSKKNLTDSQCINKNLHILTDGTSYQKMANKITQIYHYHGLTFSYPSNPIFYLLLREKPFYFSNSYDTAAETSQQKQIQFLKKKNVQYLIFDINQRAVQDSVPEYIRSGTTLRYILNNFQAIDRVNNFIIFRKSNSPNIFTNAIIDNSYKKYLLNIDLKSIPQSEGFYKQAEFAELGENSFDSLQSLQKFIKQHSILGDTMLLSLTYKKLSAATTEITMTSDDMIKTKIYFHSCPVNYPCIINISRSPLFFAPRRIQSITITNESDIATIRLARNRTSIFW